MRHRHVRAAEVAAIVLLSSAAALHAQATIQEIRLEEGRDDINRLVDPVYDTSGVAPLAVGAVTATYDRSELFVRRGGGNLFTRGPEYKLHADVDVAALFADALRSQAEAMGFARATDGQAAWQLGATIRDIYLESRQVPYGATLFYGYLDVEVQLDDPAGARATVPMRLHHYYGAYNAGMGRRDEAVSGAAHLLVEGAQELLARLNRAQIKAPPHASVMARLDAVRNGVTQDQLAALRAVGLSGLESATDLLLTRLPGEGREGDRAAIVDALASLGSPAIVPTLAQRYDDEDEDVRWYTIKAMDYIGTDEAMRVIATRGVDDDDDGPKRLARRIAGNR